MMNNTVALLFTSLILYHGIAMASSADTLKISPGTEPTIDGVMSPGEWSDAAFVEIAIPGGRVYAKYTQTDLFVAFTDPYGYYRSTGIYVDKLCDGGVEPQTDDMWLHGSAGQFEWVGNGTGSWEQVTPSEWTFSSNTVNEYRIPLRKLDITNAHEGRIGVLFSFLDWSMGQAEITWPSGGFQNCGTPSSWATLVFTPGTTDVDHVGAAENHVSIFPNPAADKVVIQLAEDLPTSLEILDLDGNLCRKINVPFSYTEVDIRGLASGIYFLRIMSGNEVHLKKLFKR